MCAHGAILIALGTHLARGMFLTRSQRLAMFVWVSWSGVTLLLAVAVVASGLELNRWFLVVSLAVWLLLVAFVWARVRQPTRSVTVRF